MLPPRPVLRAFLLAPLAAPLGYWLGLLLWGVVEAGADRNAMPGGIGGALRLLGYVLAVGAPIAYGTTLVGGVPVYLALRRLGRLGRLPLWIGGATLGAVVALLLAPSLRSELFSIPFPWWTGVALGVLVAELFRRLHPPEA